MADDRTAEVIEQDLAQARQRLAENLSELISEIHPKAVTHRAVQDTKTKVRQGIDDGKQKCKDASRFVISLVKDETGWKPVPIAIAAVITAGVIALVVVKK